ncbi:MAG: T9SS type A sorting domain-containing protein [Bacteroidetes bacterium]|nr:T9SS type A sorting domain-containing protein [Bacteroidota bacterium]
MNRFNLFTVFALSLLVFELQAQTFSWNGATSMDWGTNTNWTPNGIPGPGSTVNVNSDAVPNICQLDANRGIAVLNVSAGTLDLNGFTLTTTTRSSFSGGLVSGGGISAPSITTMSNTTFQGAMSFTKTGGNNNFWAGNNTFNGPVTITNAGSAVIRMGNTNGDIFNDDANFINTSTSYIDIAYRDTTWFNGNLTLDNTGVQGMRIGAANNTTTVSYLVSGSALLTNGFINGQLLIRRMTQAGTAANGTFTPSTATLANCNFGGNFSVTTTATTLTIANSTFSASNTFASETNMAINGVNNFSTTSGLTQLTINGSTAGMTWVGGNTFGDVIITNNSPNLLRMAGTNGDDFARTASFVNTGAGGIQVAFRGTNTFADDITLANSASGGIAFGSSTGTSVQAAGRLINDGYSNGQLTINRFTQTSTEANDAFAPTVFSATASTFNGNFSVNTTGTSITLNTSDFNGTNNSFTSATTISITTCDFPRSNVVSAGTSLTLNNASTFSTTSGSTQLTHNSATGTVSWTGGNTFGNITITKNSAQTLRLSNTSGDTYLGTSTFVNNGTNALEVSYNGTSSFAGNITLTNSATGGISFGASAGSTTQSTGRLINGGFTLGPLTLNRFTQSASTANDAFSPTVFNALNSTLNGNFSITTSTGGIVLNGSSFTATNTFVPATALTLSNANSFSTVSGSTQLTNSVSAGTVAWTGGNTFGAVSITNNAVGPLRLANTISDNFNSTSSFTNTAAGGIQISYAGGVSTFADDIMLNNTGTGGISFGASTGNTTISAGSLLSGGFSSGPLTLNRVTQTATDANGTFTPTTFVALNTVLNGDFAVTATASTITITTSNFTAANTFSAATTISLNNANTFSTASGSTAFTIGGGGNVTWTGGNTFGNVTVTTNSANYLRMANTNGDVFTGSATFVQNAAGILSPAYNASNSFAGDISTVGTATAITFGAGTGTVVINGSATQTFSGSAARIPIVRRLSMNTSGAGNLTLAVPVNISLNLTWTSGLINTDGSNLLTLTDETVTTTSGNSNAYVSGPIQYVLNSNSTTRSVLNLPLGKGGEWRPAILSVAHATSTSYTYRAEVFAASAEALGLDVPAGVVDVSNTRYWDIGRFLTSTMAAAPSADLRTATGQEPIIQLFFDQSDGITDGNFLTICKNTDADPTSWVDIGSSGTPPYDGGANLTGSITSTSTPTAFNSFSLFTLGNLNNALPVTWVSFDVTAVQQQVQLAWQTATETNTDRFAVERSSNGKDFAEISSVPAAGNSIGLLSYRTTDRQPLSGISYYRLRQIDLDGKFDYSPIRTVNRSGAASTPSVNYVSPNPFTDVIHVALSSTGNNNVEVRIYDWTGALKEHTSSPEATLEINTADLAPGIYLVELQVGGQIHRSKLVKN